MASGSDNPNGFPFYLSPQQQQVLLQALASGQKKDSPHQPASSNPFNMSPASIHASPEQPSAMFNDIPGGSYLGSYDVEFNPDSSLDFDVSNMSNPFPDDGNTSAKSDSLENESPEKRARDEEDGSVSPTNGAKRRENGEKIPKKPGRKPLTSEPTSKRKAQNRAAQRAFRERKEKHLKDLETKVVELEKKSAETDTQNTTLRRQLQSVTAELNEYKRKVRLLNPSRPVSGGRPQAGTGNQGLQNLNSIDFQFEFPRFGYLPGPPQHNNKQGGQRSSTSSPPNPSLNAPNLNDRVVPGHRNSAVNLNGSSANSNDVNRSPTSQHDLFHSLPISRTSLDSAHYSLGSTTTGSPSGSSPSNVGPSSSCGTSPEPYNQSPMGFKPVDTMTTIGEEQPPTSNGQGHYGDISADLSFDWLAQQNGGQFDPQLFGDYREPQNNVLNFEDSFFSDAFDADFMTPYNVPSTEQPPAKSLIAQINEQQEAVEPPIKDELSENKEGINCVEVWNKIQTCDKVKNGGFDLDSLCSELQTKAKCSGEGPVVQEEEFETILGKYLGADFMNKCGDDMRRHYAEGQLQKGQQNGQQKA